MEAYFASLPSVDLLLERPAVAALLKRYRREHVLQVLRRLLRDCRREVADGARFERPVWIERIETALTAGVDPEAGPRRAINATGVVLHTGLGRAPLAPAAVEALGEAAAYCDLEFDLETGRRGSRLDHIEGLLRQVTTCEAAVAVNNNAAAVMLMINTMAAGGRVAVSRGELVEIGGSFRIPDIIAASGAEICEVGTTNRTHLRDYEAAIDGGVGLILAVHPSNYKVSGFTAAVPLAELAALGRRRGVPLAYDLGGGVLEDLARWGLPHEPVVQQAIDSGADLVSFSGDKVLGGPQCGIIAGNEEWVGRLRKNPLMRALRCDKLVLAALAATLRLYRLHPDELVRRLPTLQRLTAPLETLCRRGESLIGLMEEAARTALAPTVEETEAQAGSGALPAVEVPSLAVALSPQGDAGRWAKLLRACRPAVVGRVHGGRLFLDMRTVEDNEVPEIAACLNAVAAKVAARPEAL